MDIFRALEIYKFAVDKSLFLKCDYEYLKAKSFDLEMLADYIFCIYNNYIEEVDKSKPIKATEGTNNIINII